MNNSHDATASMLGYLYQCRYALLAALDEAKDNPGHELSIERFDDIAFEQNGTPSELIQTKHHHVSQPDLSDHSVDVWKTLFIWIKRAVENPSSIVRTRFVLLTTAGATDGSAMALLRSPDDERGAMEAIEKLRNVAITSTNQSTKNARDAFLSMDDSITVLLFSNIWLFDNAPNIVDARSDIETALFYSAPAGKVDTLVEHLEGWWFSRVIAGLTHQDNPAITLSSIQSKISEIREGLKSDSLPLSPDIDDIEIPALEAGDHRCFIRQMRAIELSDAPMVAAVQDYYKAYTQRSRWAREELLLDDEAHQYEKKLGDALDRERLADEQAWSSTDEEEKKRFGRKLFHWSRRHPLPLRNRDELWLSSGSFQMLSDRCQIGWHADYESLFSVSEAAE